MAFSHQCAKRRNGIFTQTRKNAKITTSHFARTGNLRKFRKIYSLVLSILPAVLGLDGFQPGYCLVKTFKACANRPLIIRFDGRGQPLVLLADVRHSLVSCVRACVRATC